MRVLVIGSDVKDTLGDFDTPEEYEKAKKAWPFRRACLELGKLICRRKHEMMVLSSDPNHADRLVLEGYQFELGRARPKSPILVSSGTPDDGENYSEKIPDIQTMFPKLKFEEYPVGQDYPFNRVPIVQWADVLIIVGGRSSAHQFVDIGFALRKVIIPIRSFGGEANNVWNKLEQTFDAAFSKGVITQEALHGLAITGYPNEDQIAHIFSSADALHHDARRDRFGVSARAILVAQIAAVMIWFALLGSFRYIGRYGEIIAVLMLIAVSVSGILARAAYAAFTAVTVDPDRVITSRYQLYTELTLVAPVCVLSLIAFFFNAATLKGDIDEILTVPASFHRESLLLSAMGLSAAFLLERTMERIRAGKAPVDPKPGELMKS